MQINRGNTPTATGPADWFTGEVRIDALATPNGPSRLSASHVHFAPGARTHWHTHPNGQTIHVTEGICICQSRGGEIETVLPGQSVFFEPGEVHWHGASPERLMSHIAMQQADESGNAATWGEPVSDAEYGRGAPPTVK